MKIFAPAAGIFFFIAACCTSTLQGRSDLDGTPRDKPALPEGKLIRPLGPKESWEIQFEYGKKANVRTGPTEGGNATEAAFSEFSAPKRLQFTRLTPFMMIRFVGEKPGESIEYYDSDLGNLFYVNKSYRNSVVRELPPDPGDWDSPPMVFRLYFSIKRGEFLDLSWIHPENYIGVEEIEGRPCLVFQRGDTKAWIDLESREPVIWKQNDEIRRFFKNPTPSSIEFPEQVKNHIRAYKELSEKLQSRPPRGG